MKTRIKTVTLHGGKTYYQAQYLSKKWPPLTAIFICTLLFPLTILIIIGCFIKERTVWNPIDIGLPHDTESLAQFEIDQYIKTETEERQQEMADKAEIKSRKIKKVRYQKYP